LLVEIVEALLAAEDGEEWQMRSVSQVMNELVASSAVGDVPSSFALSFDDLRTLLADHIRGTPSRPDYYRGGITITSAHSMSWLPHRVVCLLGMDQSALGVGRSDTDDLLAESPAFGDRDPRGELRQALLSLLLSTRQHLVVLRDGRDVVTNAEVPEATLLAELCEPLVRAVGADVVADVEVHHPRQSYDRACFVPAALGSSGPWSFDRRAASAARVPRVDVVERGSFLTRARPAAPTGVIDLDDLREVVRHPVKAFVARTLEAVVPKRAEALPSLLPVAPAPLERWALGTGLLAMLANGSTVDEWVELERRRGSLPPGRLGGLLAAEIADEVQRMDEEFRALGGGAQRSLDVDVAISDGTRLAGRVVCRGGPLDLPGDIGGWSVGGLDFTRPKPVRFIDAWIDLMLLVVTAPDEPWRALIVRRPKSGAKSPTCDQRVPAWGLGEQREQRRAAAIRALDVVVDAYRRALSEPIPLFPTLSYELSVGRGARKDWEAVPPARGDLSDDSVVLTYGHHDFDSLLAIEAIASDPPGASSSRVRRFAEWFWGAVSEAMVKPAEGGAT